MSAHYACNICNVKGRFKLCGECRALSPFHDPDEEMFRFAIFEFQAGTIRYNLDQLETRYFDPFQPMESCFLSSLPADLDLDDNIDKLIGNCTYETEEGLESQFKNNDDQNNFSIKNFTARSNRDLNTKHGLQQT